MVIEAIWGFAELWVIEQEARRVSRPILKVKSKNRDKARDQERK
jgi:hypothetical protein